MANNDLSTLMILHCQLQSVLHTIDELEGHEYYKHGLKQKTNQYLKYIEPKVDAIARKIPVKESDAYVQIVKVLDDVVKSIKIEITE